MAGKMRAPPLEPAPDALLDAANLSDTLAAVKDSRYYFSKFAFRFYWPDATGLRLH